MGRKRKPPPLWWLLGYVAQYQPKPYWSNVLPWGLTLPRSMRRVKPLRCRCPTRSIAGYPKPGPFNRAVKGGVFSSQ